MKKIFTLCRIITSNIMMMKNYYLAASFYLAVSFHKHSTSIRLKVKWKV